MNDAEETLRLVRIALAEDGERDVTSDPIFAPGEPAPTGTGEPVATAKVVARADGVVAGLRFAEVVFHEVSGPSVRAWNGNESPVNVSRQVADGERVSAGQELMTVSGPVRQLLRAERTALNFLTHLSGIATLTRRWADAVEGTGAKIRDSRKTLPGLRSAQKYAVQCGGGVNHRMSLADEALIKDNHVAAAGSLTAAFQAVRASHPELTIEVECDTPAQVREAIEAGARSILLDNMTTGQTAEAVRLARHATDGHVLLEASGGLTLDRAREVAETGVDYLAVGALTHSAPALDIGLDFLDDHDHAAHDRRR